MDNELTKKRIVYVTASSNQRISFVIQNKEFIRIFVKIRSALRDQHYKNSIVIYQNQLFFRNIATNNP